MVKDIDIIDTVIECEKRHPESEFYNKDNNTNHAIIKDPSCISCDAVSMCSDFAKNRYAYKQALLESINNDTPFISAHLCDWCGFILVKKNDSNHFCKGCGRTIKIDGLDQIPIKEIHNYNPPASIKPLMNAAPTSHKICNFSVAEKDPTKEILPERVEPEIIHKPSDGARSHKKGTGEKQFSKIVAALTSTPLTYNELLEAVPEFKLYKRPLNSLRPVILRYGMGEGNKVIEYTEDIPVKLKLIQKI